MDENTKKSNLRHVAPMARSELEQLHTGSLLTRLRKLHALHERYEDSDWSEPERQSMQDMIAFKNTPAWQQAYEDVKAVLATREHVERGSKARRQQAAWRKKHR